MSGAVSAQRTSGASGGYSGPIGLLGGRPDGETYPQWFANQLTGGAQGLIMGNALDKHVAGKAGEQQARYAASALQAEQDRRSGLVKELRAKYGIGDGADAQTAGRTLADYLKGYYNDYLTNQLGQVDNQFSSATKTSRQNLARVGQLGSGLDTSTRTGNLADFIRARQAAISKAAAARDQLSTSLTGQRVNLENQINAGTLANPDFNSLVGQQQQLIGQARAQIPAEAVGNLFTTAGQSYQLGTQQGAYGNRGLSAFGFGAGGGGSGGGSGRITGG